MDQLQVVHRVVRRGSGRVVCSAVLAAGLSLTMTQPAAALQQVDAGLQVAPSGPAAKTAEVRHSRVRVAPGVELDVAQAGPQDGVPVVLLHGLTDSWFSWSRVLDLLPAGVRAIVPSLRGHGDSERPICCYQLSDFAGDVGALLDSLRIPRAHVIGHSMGGLVALRFATTFRDRVDHLVIVGSGASARNADVIEFNEVVQQFNDPIDLEFIREFQLSTTARPLPAAFLDGVVRESSKVPAHVWRGALGGLLSTAADHDVSRITAPTLILWGELDAFFPRADQELLLRSIPRARLITYPDAAHAPNWEIPDRVVADIADFLRIAEQPRHRRNAVEGRR